MKIVEKKISELVPYDNNPRINEQAVDLVANSIKDFGFNVPVVIDENNVIVAGHTRTLAAKSLGLDKVPCIIADDLDEAKIKAFRLADNKVSELSTWDHKKLNEELAKLVGSNMTDYGFEVPYEMLPDKEEQEQLFENEEIDLDDFSEESFRHECERCGFKWN